MDQQISLLIIGPNAKNSSGSATVRYFSKSVRFIASMKKGGLSLLIAVLCVFVPVLHFVLVPAFLIAAILGFVFTYKRLAEILEASAPCPSCGKGLAIGKVEPNWPVSVVCSSCGVQAYVQDSALPPLISISTMEGRL